MVVVGLTLLWSSRGGDLVVLRRRALIVDGVTLRLTLKVVVLIKDAVLLDLEVLRVVMVVLSGACTLLSLGDCLVVVLHLVFLLIPEGTRGREHVIILQLVVVAVRVLPQLAVRLFAGSMIGIGCLGTSLLVAIISIAP